MECLGGAKPLNPALVGIAQKFYLGNNSALNSLVDAAVVEMAANPIIKGIPRI
jgi:hypothetical protein